MKPHLSVILSEWVLPGQVELCFILCNSMLCILCELFSEVTLVHDDEQSSWFNMCLGWLDRFSPWVALCISLWDIFTWLAAISMEEPVSSHPGSTWCSHSSQASAVPRCCVLFSIWVVCERSGWYRRHTHLPLQMFSTTRALLKSVLTCHF